MTYDYTKSKQVCSAECLKEFEWRYVLYVRGKDYYPRPKD